MQIHVKTLTELRIRKGLTKTALAEKARLDYRQMQRLEAGEVETRRVRESTLLGLAEALGVEPAVLTGERPLPEAPSRPERPQRAQTTMRIDPEARLAYALVERRYGVNMTSVVNMAPLFFGVLAEGSLAWRRRKLEEVRQAADDLHAFGRIGHLAFANAAARALDASDEEEKSIEARDLFGTICAPDTRDLGYDRSEANPFADYLRELAASLDPGDVTLDPNGRELGFSGMDAFPGYRVCESDLARIAGGSADAAYALRFGHVRLDDIPPDLMTEERAAERVAWLAETGRKASQRFLDELHRSLVGHPG